jgi:hypothetical protein
MYERFNPYLDYDEKVSPEGLKTAVRALNTWPVVPKDSHVDKTKI